MGWGLDENTRLGRPRLLSREIGRGAGGWSSVIDRWLFGLDSRFRGNDSIRVDVGWGLDENTRLGRPRLLSREIGRGAGGFVACLVLDNVYRNCNDKEELANSEQGECPVLRSFALIHPNVLR